MIKTEEEAKNFPHGKPQFGWEEPLRDELLSNSADLERFLP